MTHRAQTHSVTSTQGKTCTAIAFAAFYEAGTGAPVTTLAAPSIILFVFGFTGYSAVTSLRA